MAFLIVLILLVFVARYLIRLALVLAPVIMVIGLYMAVHDGLKKFTEDTPAADTRAVNAPSCGYRTADDYRRVKRTPECSVKSR